MIFALAGIGALLAFFFAAWKFGGQSNEQIPNLGTTNRTATNRVLPPATGTKAAPKKPASRITPARFSSCSPSSTMRASRVLG